MKSDMACRDSFSDTLAVPVVEEDGSAGLGKAVHLLLDRLLKQSAFG